MKYISSIFKTGAVRKTPSRVLKRIRDEISLQDDDVIIEFGAGKGEITKEILRKEDSIKLNYYAFEIHEGFAFGLQQALPGIHVITETAFEFGKHLPPGTKADLIISSMPLSFYSRSEKKALIKMMLAHLKIGGKILILLHAFWIIGFLRKQLPSMKTISFPSFPPYFLLVFTNN